MGLFNKKETRFTSDEYEKVLRILNEQKFLIDRAFAKLEIMETNITSMRGAINRSKALPNEEDVQKKIKSNVINSATPKTPFDDAGFP